LEKKLMLKKQRIIRTLKTSNRKQIRIWSQRSRKTWTFGWVFRTGEKKTAEKKSPKKQNQTRSKKNKDHGFDGKELLRKIWKTGVNLIKWFGNYKLTVKLKWKAPHRSRIPKAPRTLLFGFERDKIRKQEEEKKRI